MKTPLAAALLAVAASSPALAAPPPQVHTFSSSVSITGLNYELIDLNPNDGIAPSVEFLDGFGYTSLEIRNRYGAVDRSGLTRDMFGSTFASGMTQGGSAFAAVGYDSGSGVRLSAGGTGATVGSRTNGSRTSYDTFGEARAYGLQVMLSPGTEMRWSGSFEAMAFADRWWGTTAAQAASALVKVTSGLYGTTTPESQLFGAAAFANPQAGGQIDREAGAFGFSFTNGGTDWSRYSGSVIASATGGIRPLISGTVAPIPEPSTYALMAAGLGVIGMVSRRRQAKV
jgi:hypothetical protein